MSFAEPRFIAELFYRPCSAAVAGLEKGGPTVVSFVVGVLCQPVVSLLVQGAVGTGYREYTYCAGTMGVASMAAGSADAAVVGAAHGDRIRICLADNALVMEQRLSAAGDC